MEYDENAQLDVKVINAYKSYKGNDVIKGLDMNIKSGSIYGLLGSSGCGKSTLLQCILGLISLDSGRIDLKADTLREIGYMPQDLCLDVTLTIRESLNYYGSLYNMTKEQVKRRVKELMNFLQLPDIDRYIKDISGGQCRRVSLAICLLHDPKIIILDEPTVGIDPILRHEIWEEFVKMTNTRKKTIIITTHYIEEANQAHCVGLMRNGKLVEEGTPSNILSKYNVDTLESAFLSLCFNQEEYQVINEHVPVDFDNVIKEKNNPQTKNLLKSGKSIDFEKIKALFIKNVRLFSRDYYLIFTMFILPIITAVFFCTCLGKDMKDLKVAIINDEINYFDCQYSNGTGCIFDKGYNQKLSCVVINYYLMTENIEFIPVTNRYDAEMLFNESKIVAYMHFPINYTKELIPYIDDYDNYDIEKQLYMHFIKHNAIIKNQLYKDTIDAMKFLMNMILSGCSKNPKSLQMPFTFNTIVGKEVKSYSNSIVPSFISLGSLYFPSILTVSVMHSERLDGIFGRSMFAGVKVMELLISMFSILTIIVVIQLIIFFSIIYKIYAYPIIINNGLVVYFSLYAMQGWIGFFVGVIVSGLFSSRVGAVYAINGWLVCQFIMSGVIWPIEAQSKLLKLFSEALPVRIVSQSMTEISLKGWTIDHPSIINAVLFLFGYIGFLVLFLIVLEKFKKDMWVLRK